MMGQQAKGSVLAFVDGELPSVTNTAGVTGVFQSQELPALLQNSNVTSINGTDISALKTVYNNNSANFDNVLDIIGPDSSCFDDDGTPPTASAPVTDAITAIQDDVPSTFTAAVGSSTLSVKPPTTSIPTWKIVVGAGAAVGVGVVLLPAETVAAVGAAIASLFAVSASAKAPAAPSTPNPIPQALYQDQLQSYQAAQLAPAFAQMRVEAMVNSGALASSVLQGLPNAQASFTALKTLLQANGNAYTGTLDLPSGQPLTIGVSLDGSGNFIYTESTYGAVSDGTDSVDGNRVFDSQTATFNASGVDIGNSFDFVSGTSQTQQFTNLPTGLTKLYLDYNGAPGASSANGGDFILTNGNGIDFAPGTFSNPVYTASSSGITVSPTASDGATLGTLAFNTATDTDRLTLQDGLVVTLPNITHNVIAAPAANATPEQALLGYLSNLGKPLTASALDSLNYAYLNPTGTAYTVTPVITAGSAAAAAARRVRVLRSGTGMTYMLESVAVKPATSPSTATFTLNNAAPGAVVTGIAGDTNVLQATSTDLSRDTITNVQTLNASTGVQMTGSQFGGFTGIHGVDTINGSANVTLTITTAGSYALSASDLGVKSFAAQDWGGTTLTGNATAGQALYASLYGNDTLKAGSGAGDVLVAGEGVDTLTGNAAGGDAFIATSGLAAGSHVTGFGAGNTLQLNQGDLSACTISGVATLLTADATLTAAQFGGFTQITDAGIFSHQGRLFAATGGLYDLSAKVTGAGDFFDMTALSNAGTTLKGQGSYYGTLTASALGNDSLSNAGTLVAGGGLDTLSNATTVIAGGGLKAGSSVQNVTNLDAGGDLSGVTIAGVNTLALTGGDSVTLTLAQLNGFGGGVTGAAGSEIVLAGGGTLNWQGAKIFDFTAAAATGTVIEEDKASGVAIEASALGNDTLISNSSTGVTLDASGTGGNDAAYAYYGSGNILDALDSSGAITLLSNYETAGVLDAAGSTGSVTLNAAFSYGETLIAGDGTDTLISTGGNVLYGGAGSDTFYVAGGDTASGGSGSSVFITNVSLTGATLTGGRGADILAATGGAGAQIDLSGAAIANIATLNDATSTVSLTAAELAGFSTLTNFLPSGAATLLATTAGTYTLSGKTVNGLFFLSADGVDVPVTLIGNDANGETITGSSTGANEILTLGNGAGDSISSGGNGDTVTIGNGAGDTIIATGGNARITGGNGGDSYTLGANALVYGGSGGDTFAFGLGGDAVQGNGGSDAYVFAAGDGKDTLNNYHTDTGKSVLKMAALSKNVTLSRSGNDLLASVNATSDQVTVQNYFAAAAYQLASIQFSDTSWTAAAINSMFNLQTMTGGASLALATNNNLVDAVGANTITVTHGAGNRVNLAGAGNKVSDDGTSGTNAVADIASGSGNSLTLVGAADTIALNGAGDVATLSGKSDILTLAGSGNKAAVSAATGTATVSGAKAVLELTAASAETITFTAAATGTLKLDLPAGFTGTVAGMAIGDGIDLGSFLYSGHPTISGVTGSGAAGTATSVTVTDGAAHTTLLLLNQYAAQYPATPSAYTLSADAATPNPATLLQLAAGH